jgi:alpha-tubulin suppressor-like RCC1 family protein
MLTIACSDEQATYSVKIYQDEESQEYVVNNGAYLEEPNIQEKEGYFFLGWYTSQDGCESYLSPWFFSRNKVNESVSICPRYVENQYEKTIIYNPDQTSDIVIDEDESIIDFNLSFYHAMLLTSKGDLYSWGTNHHGILGYGNLDQSNTPINIESYFDFDSNERVRDIQLGVAHSAALTSENRVFVWGLNNQGQFADDQTVVSHVPRDITNSLNLSDNENIVKLSSGYYHLGALTSNNRLLVWGNNDYGQLGDGTQTKRFSPVDITENLNLLTDETIEHLSFDNDYSMILTSFGRVLAWGSNAYGQLGDGSENDSLLPKDITPFFQLEEGDKIIQLATGLIHAMALTQEGKLYTWGHNSTGQLGNNSFEDSYEPTLINQEFTFNKDEKIIEISAGGAHSAAITNQGRLFIWGRNNLGQLGIFNQINQSRPIDLSYYFYLKPDETFTSVSLGPLYSSVMTSSGTVYVFGKDIYEAYDLG